MSGGTSGPFLYDEGPEDLHTGTPRRSNGVILGVLGATVLVGVGMAVALPLVRGSGDEQAREVVGVFTAALAAGDLETAGGLLCEDERARAEREGLTDGEAAQGYARPGEAEVAGVEPGRYDGGPSQQVRVRWADGASGAETTIVVVPEDGPKVCGSTPAP